MKVKLDLGALCPTKAHADDAGYDIYSREDKLIPAHDSAVFDTGVHIQLPDGTVGMLKSRSGLNVKHGITSEGVIDVGFTGSIRAKLYNHSDENYMVHKGERITQIVIMPLVMVNELQVVDTLDEADRGSDGYGSSGK